MRQPLRAQKVVEPDTTHHLRCGASEIRATGGSHRARTGKVLGSVPPYSDSENLIAHSWGTGHAGALVTPVMTRLSGSTVAQQACS
jgi:hypothetical protein